MHSKVLERLRNNEVVLSFNPTPTVQPHFAEMAGMLGVDCVWIDYEHHNMTDHDMFNLCLGARSSGADPLIRIRKGEQQVYFRPFELGATGLMYPHCKSGEEAREVVRNAKFFPLGQRGIDGVEPAACYGTTPLCDYLEEANRETFIVVQIEDREGVECIDEIAATPGVDVLFVGPQDLRASYGDPLGADDRLEYAIQCVAAAAEKYGKHWGLSVASAAAAEDYTKMGARFFNYGAVITIIRQSLQQIVGDFSSLRTQI